MNSRVLYFCILITAALGSIRSGSAAPLPSSPSPPVESEKPSLSKEDHYDQEGANTAYAEWRQIGLLSEGARRCPEVKGWIVDPLLDLALRKAGENAQSCGSYDDRSYDDWHKSQPREVHLDFEDHRELHKLGLDRYCIYTRRTDQAGSPVSPGLSKVTKDRMVVSFTSAGDLPTDELSGRIWKALAEEVPVHTVQSQPGYPLRFKGEPGVRLAFIDSEPDGEGLPPKPDPGESPHGFTLAYLARDLICSPRGEDCAATIATRLALGYRDFDPKKPTPEAPRGHMGLVSDLAAAIITEVVHWREFHRDQKLILNLSLGWDGEGFDDLKKGKISKLDHSVQSVYKALQFARRSGVLVIAAAGNQRGGQKATKWPLLPAAWELKPPTLCPLFLGRKTVYAVGGVDGQGLPVPNSRFGGRPRLVAYADHSVAHVVPDDPTAIYTGTSVSAAVTSSIAAVIWHLRPELTPSQVMRLVTRSGKRLPTRADFYPWKKLLPAPPMRQLSLCGAFVQACGPNGTGCDVTVDSPLTCDKGSTEFPPLGDLPAKKQTASEIPSPPSSSVFMESQRWVFPQPDVMPCPGCTLVREPPDELHQSAEIVSAEIVLEITEEWLDQAEIEGVALDKATLIITQDDHDVSYDLQISSDALMTRRSRHRVVVPDIGRSLTDTAFSAQIIFGLTTGTTGKGPTSVLNPVYVVKN